MTGGVNIETTQNVTINYELASLGDRIVAYLIDLFIMVGYVIAVSILFKIIGGGTPMIFMFLVFPVALYHLLCELFMNGQSVGKRSRKMKVVKLDGSAPDFFNYVLRWVLRPVDNFYGLGLLVVLLNGKGQRLGDLAAGTTVVKVQLRTTLQDTIFSQVSENYQPVFPEVMRLNDAQMRLVSDVLQHNKGELNYPMLKITFDKIKAIMNVEPDMSPLEFLRTVLQDYNHYSKATH